MSLLGRKKINRKLHRRRKIVLWLGARQCKAQARTYGTQGGEALASNNATGQFNKPMCLRSKKWVYRNNALQSYYE